MILTTPEYCADEAVRGPTTHRGCWGCGRLFRASSDAERYCPACIKAKTVTACAGVRIQARRPAARPVVVPVQASAPSPSAVLCPCCGQPVSAASKAISWFDMVLAKAGKRHVFGRISVDFSRMVFAVGRKRVKLTKTQWRLLAVLIANMGMVMSREVLLNMVFGYKEITSRTIDTFISGLRKYFGQNIENVHGVGYRFIPITQSAQGER